MDQQPKPKGIRIVSSNGDREHNYAQFTKIFDSEGRDITAEIRVRKITITHEARGICVATIECFPAEVDVTVMSDKVVTRAARPEVNEFEEKHLQKELQKKIC